MGSVGTAAAGQTLIGSGVGLSPTFASIGTNSGLTAHGVIVGEGNGAFTATSVGTSGQVLTSNGAGNDPTFQPSSASGAITTITGNSGGAESPSAGNFNVLGTGSITVAGTANTETVQLTGLTNHAVLVGAGTATITKVASGTTGQVLQTNTGADPTWSTATYPSTAGTSGNVLTSDGTNFNSSAPVASAGGLGFYGDASDGAQTFDGTTTILGVVPSASTYTLTRDLFLGSSTINNGVTIIPNGFRIFCQGTLTNNGTIQHNGNPGVAGTGGAALFNTLSSINTFGAGGQAISTAGGGASTGAGTNGTNATVSITNTLGGVGGAGGAGSSAGGAGGTAHALTSLFVPPRNAVAAINSFLFSTSFQTNAFQGGTGGGGGGGDATHIGGAGGSGGGIVIIAAKTFAGTGTISANGGAGANANASSTNSGGGGGGGGGIVIIISNSVSAGAITGQTITVSGGAFGTKVGTGVNGNTGASGFLSLIPN